MVQGYAFINCHLIDCTGSEPIDGAFVIVEGDRIQEVGEGAPGGLPPHGVVFDVKGKTLIPGLIDAHVHACLIEADVHRAFAEPGAIFTYRVGQILEETLQMGFTTVRDAGLADLGFKLAVERGYINGPRMLICNSMISQTGGHGDFRQRLDPRPPLAPHGVCSMPVICDGPDKVRSAAREQLRNGAGHIKVMAAGGGMSPTDQLDTTQYTVEELRAAVQEAQAAGTYAMAHTYSSASIKNCMEAEIRTVEYGNLLDEEAAQRIKEAGAYLVPTLVTYETIVTQGAEHGIPEFNLYKMNIARQRSIEALQTAHNEGVKIGSGSDLLGPFQKHKVRELILKTEVMSPKESLLSATRVNAEMLMMEKDIGAIEQGKFADLLLLDGDPLKDISLIENKENIRLIMKSGRLYKNLDWC